MKHTSLLFILNILSLLGILSVSPIVHAQTSLINATVKISVCGNDLVEADEECDNSDLGNATCSTRGYATGDLACAAACTFDESDCSGSANTNTGNNNGGGGGGGGGGGSSAPPQTSIIFTGRAYPGAQVVILKDGQLSSSIQTSTNANFEVILTGMASGNYNFSIYSFDKANNKSSSMTFTINLAAETTTKVSGIFVSPTIEADKQSVRQGDNMTFFGYSYPQSQITLAVSSEQEFFLSTMANDNGYYFYNLDSSLLTYGEHSVRSRATYLDESSDFSQPASFVVGSISSYSPSPHSLAVDLNQDNKVNLIDFSILAYWYNRSAPPSDTDLNADSRVDLIDFSILAYHWTG